MKSLAYISLVVLLSSCSHTINFRASHFAVPITGENQWDGHVAIVGSSVTKVTVVNDTSANPPRRDSILINSDVDAGDLVAANNVGVDLSLSVLKSLDVYLDNSLLGLRWQFLNHSAKSDVWVASVQGAYGTKSTSTSTTYGNDSADSDSDVKTQQVGASVGYKLARVVPYISYIHETHDVSTKVNNNHGDFGPYSDKGTHAYTTVGVSSHGKGLVYAVEYNFITIDWDRSKRDYQNAVGIKLGFAW